MPETTYRTSVAGSLNWWDDDDDEQSSPESTTVAGSLDWSMSDEPAPPPPQEEHSPLLRLPGVRDEPRDERPAPFSRLGPAERPAGGDLHEGVNSLIEGVAAGHHQSAMAGDMRVLMDALNTKNRLETEIAERGGEMKERERQKLSSLNALIERNSGQLSERQGKLSKLPPSQHLEDLIGGDIKGALARSKGGVALEIFARSAVPSIKAAGMAAVAGAAGTAAGGPVAGATAATAGAGYMSGRMEFNAAVLEGLREDGVDIERPEEIEVAMTDDERMSEIYGKALVRGGVIGSFDGVAQLLPFLKPFNPAMQKGITKSVLSALVSSSSQGALGGGGEATAQLITEGEINPGEVAAEVIGEFVTAPAEITAAWASNKFDYNEDTNTFEPTDSTPQAKKAADYANEQTTEKRKEFDAQRAEQATEALDRSLREEAPDDTPVAEKAIKEVAEKGGDALDQQRAANEALVGTKDQEIETQLLREELASYLGEDVDVLEDMTDANVRTAVETYRRAIEEPMFDMEDQIDDAPAETPLTDFLGEQQQGDVPTPEQQQQPPPDVPQPDPRAAPEPTADRAVPAQQAVPPPTGDTEPAVAERPPDPEVPRSAPDRSARMIEVMDTGMTRSRNTRANREMGVRYTDGSMEYLNIEPAERKGFYTVVDPRTKEPIIEDVKTLAKAKQAVLDYVDGQQNEFREEVQALARGPQTEEQEAPQAEPAFTSAREEVRARRKAVEDAGYEVKRDIVGYSVKGPNIEGTESAETREIAAQIAGAYSQGRAQGEAFVKQRTEELRAKGAVEREKYKELSTFDKVLTPEELDSNPNYGVGDSVIVSHGYADENHSHPEGQKAPVAFTKATLEERDGKLFVNLEGEDVEVEAHADKGGLAEFIEKRYAKSRYPDRYKKETPALSPALQRQVEAARKKEAASVSAFEDLQAVMERKKAKGRKKTTVDPDTSTKIDEAIAAAERLATQGRQPLMGKQSMTKAWNTIAKDFKRRADAMFALADQMDEKEFDQAMTAFEQEQSAAEQSFREQQEALLKRWRTLKPRKPKAPPRPPPQETGGEVFIDMDDIESEYGNFDPSDLKFAKVRVALGSNTTKRKQLRLARYAKTLGAMHDKMAESEAKPNMLLSDGSVGSMRNMIKRMGLEQDKLLALGLANAQGMYDRRTNTVLINMAKVQTEEEAVSVYLHETMAHGGLRNVVGRENTEVLMNNIWDGSSRTMRKRIVANAEERGYKGQQFSTLTYEGRSNLVEEYVARIAEDLDTPKSNHVLVRVINEVQKWLTKNLGIRWSDGAIRSMLRKIRTQMEEGLTPQGERPADGVMFSLTRAPKASVIYSTARKNYRNKTKEALADHIDSVYSKFGHPDAPAVFVAADRVSYGMELKRLGINNMNDIRSLAGRSGGAYEGESNTVLINLGTVKTKEQAVEVLLHEVVAHGGLRSLLGEEKTKSLMLDVFNYASSKVKKRIENNNSTYKYDYDLSTAHGKAKATEEYVARIAEQLDTPAAKSTLQKVIDYIKLFLAENLGVKWSDGAVRSMLRRIRTQLEDGTAPAEGQRGDGVMFSLTGDKQTVKNLRATHNLHSKNLDLAVEKGRILAPSIAINRNDKSNSWGVDSFSDDNNISVVFKPKALSWGEDSVFRGDAFTPTYPDVDDNGKLEINGVSTTLEATDENMLLAMAMRAPDQTMDLWRDPYTHGEPMIITEFDGENDHFVRNWDSERVEAENIEDTLAYINENMGIGDETFTGPEGAESHKYMSADEVREDIAENMGWLEGFYEAKPMRGIPIEDIAYVLKNPGEKLKPATVAKLKKAGVEIRDLPAPADVLDDTQPDFYQELAERQSTPDVMFSLRPPRNEEERKASAAAYAGMTPEEQADDLAISAGNVLRSDKAASALRKMTGEERVGAFWEGVKDKALFINLKARNRRNLRGLISKKDMPSLHKTMDLEDKMSARRNSLDYDSWKRLQQWRKLSNKENAALSTLMHSATRLRIDPSMDHELLPGVSTQYNKWREKQHDVLQGLYETLSSDGQALFTGVREDYKDNFKRYVDALDEKLKARIEAAGNTTSASTLATIDEMTKTFQRELQAGPYFPLMRYGQFYAKVSDEEGNIAAYSMFETIGERSVWIKDMKAQGYTNKQIEFGKKLESPFDQAESVNPEFVANINELLPDDDPSTLAIKDGIYQMYLQTLPDMSRRKHFLHRKGLAGYHGDARRNYSNFMSHSNAQQARLEYGWLINSQLIDMREEAVKLQKKRGTKEENSLANLGEAMYKELNDRHKVAMSPNTSTIATTLTGMGFTAFLGYSPAAALVNLTQVSNVTLPYLAGKFGAGKTIGAMGKSVADVKWLVGRNKGDKLRDASVDSGIRKITDRLRKEDPKLADAFWRAYREGVLTQSQSSELAGAGGHSQFARNNETLSNVLEYSATLFHAAEVLNRSVTWLTAYRVSKGNEQEAVDAVWKTQFDYAQENRSPWTQGNWQRVVFLFKQYLFNMVELLGQSMGDSISQKRTPKERSVARRQLGGYLAMIGITSGAAGLPITGALSGVWKMLAEDEDDPFRPKDEAWSIMRELYGERVADAVMYGAVDAFTPLSVSDRLSLENFGIFREPYPLENPDKAREQILFEWATGPMMARALQMWDGYKMLNEAKDGYETVRAVERLFPVKAVTDAIAGARLALVGETTRHPERMQVLPPSPLAGMVKAAGFQPSALSKIRRSNLSLSAKDELITRRADKLRNDLRWAYANGESAKLNEAIDSIKRFNRSNPASPINPSSVLEEATRRSILAEDGLYLDPRTRYMLQQYGRN